MIKRKENGNGEDCVGFGGEIKEGARSVRSIFFKLRFWGGEENVD